MNIICLIPARGGSKAIPKKNIIDLAGKPLIAWTIESAANANIDARIIVSTDSQEIATIAKEHGAEIPFLRPSEFSGDRAIALDVMRHAIVALQEQEGWNADIVVYLQPTSPFRTSAQIEKAIETLVKNNELDGIVSVVDLPHNAYASSLMKLDKGKLQAHEVNASLDRHTKKQENLLVRNGPSILALKTDYILSTEQLYAGNIGALKADKISSLDIDDEEDLNIARYVAMQHPSA